MSNSLQTALRPVAAGPAVASGVLVDVVVLSGDMTLFESAKEAVGERNPVWRARSAEEAADLLLTARCGVLLVDMCAVSSRADSLVMHVVEQFPDVVICVAGSREDEPLLVHLISEGLVYRFMHKPLTARRAGMFLQAAIRHHVERRETLQVRDPLLPTQRRSARRPALLQWILAGTLLAALVVMAAYLLPGHLNNGSTAAAPTFIAGPAAPRANAILSRARAALATGRYESPPGRNALDLFQAVLLEHPGHAEARSGLDQTVARVLTSARIEIAAGHRAEAERLVQRVLAADPQRADALALSRELSPPETPSSRLALEQVAAAQSEAAPSDTSARTSVTPPDSNVPVIARTEHARSPGGVAGISKSTAAPTVGNATPTVETTAPRGRTSAAKVASAVPTLGIPVAKVTNAVPTSTAQDLQQRAAPPTAERIRVMPDPLAPRFTNSPPGGYGAVTTGKRTSRSSRTLQNVSARPVVEKNVSMQPVVRQSVSTPVASNSSSASVSSAVVLGTLAAIRASTATTTRQVVDGEMTSRLTSSGAQLSSLPRPAKASPTKSQPDQRAVGLPAAKQSMAYPRAAMPAPVPAIATVATEAFIEPERTVSRNLQTIPADEFDRIEWRDPVYPREALRNHTRGRVELEFTITTDGRVRDIVILDSEPTGTFDRAAIDALGRWRFRPRLVNGQAVPQRSSLTMRFDVDE